MLSLTEAITHCEEKAKEVREQVNTHKVVDAEEIGDCIECAKEHEQLAAWLKELKALREGKSQGEWLKVICAYDGIKVGVCSQCGIRRVTDNFCGNCGADMRKVGKEC